MPTPVCHCSSRRAAANGGVGETRRIGPTKRAATHHLWHARYMLNARERAAVRIQARVRACIVRQWGLPDLVPSYVSGMHHWSLVPYIVD